MRIKGFGAAAVTLFSAGSAMAGDPVAFQLDWTPGGISAAYYLGVEKGCFTDQNIDVTISRGYGAADAVTKVATEVADFSVTDLGTIIGTVAETGAPVKAIMPVVSVSPMAIAVRADSPITDLKGLEGHSIASSVGNAAMQYLPLGMQLSDADPAKVEQITAEGSALTGLLLQGKVDALASYVTSIKGMEAAAKEAGTELRGITYGDKLDIYNASIFTSDKMIAEKPDLVARFAKAVQCTYDAARANPEAAVDAITAGVEGMQRETQVEAVPFALSFAFDNPVFAANGYAFDLARVQHNIDVVNQVSPLSKALKAEDVVFVLPK